MNEMTYAVINQDYDKLSGFLTDMNRLIHMSPVRWEVPMFSQTNIINSSWEFIPVSIWL